MAKVKIQGNASGTGVLTVEAPNTNTDRTITLPDSTGTLATTAEAGGDLSFGGDTFGADKTIGSNDNYALSFETNNAERLKLTNDGRGLSQFTAKAWVNFNGTGTVAIRDSHNVSSITDHGTATYGVNYTNNMANTNYCAVMSSAYATSGSTNWYTDNTINDFQVGGLTAYAFQGSGTSDDAAYVTVQVFGD